MFIRLWTLKEAYVKAKGLGIAASPGLRSFSFELLLSNRTKKYENSQLSSPVNPNLHQQNGSSPTQTSEARTNFLEHSSRNGDSASSISQSSSQTIENIETITGQKSEDIERHRASQESDGEIGSKERGKAEGTDLRFNLGYGVNPFPMISPRDSIYSSGGGLSPWRELTPCISSNSESASASFGWGLSHTKEENGDRSEESSAQNGSKEKENSSDPELPVFWSFRDRTPFRIQFRQSEDDKKRWGVWLMELQGGHTSALLLEIDAKFQEMDDVKVEKQLRLRTFNTVPLQSEEVIHQNRYCRVIGFGLSA